MYLFKLCANHCSSRLAIQHPKMALKPTPQRRSQASSCNDSSAEGLSCSLPHPDSKPLWTWHWESWQNQHCLRSQASVVWTRQVDSLLGAGKMGHHITVDSCRLYMISIIRLLMLSRLSYGFLEPVRPSMQGCPRLMACSHELATLQAAMVALYVMTSTVGLVACKYGTGNSFS